MASALTLAACAPQTTVPELPQATPERWRNLDAAGVAARPAPDLSIWWQAFGDPALDALITRALADNLTVQAAALKLGAARRLEHRSRREFLPTANFRIFEETTPGASTGYFELGFDAQWEFGLFGRAEGNARVATADLNAASIDEAAARASVCAEVVKNYIELRAAQQRQQLADALVAQRARRSELMRVRLRTRLASQLEVDHAEAELQQARSDAGEPRLALRQAGAALAVLIGQNEPDVAWDEHGAQPLLPDLEIAQAPADLVRTRPEIRRAEQNVLRAAGELGIARADLYPKFGLAGSLLSATPLTGDVDHAYKAVPLVGPTVQLPIWDWGARRDIVDAREAALHASVLGYREAVLEGVAEVESALAAFSDKSAREKSAQAALALGERGTRSAQTLERLGLGDGLDESLAQLAAIDAQLAQVNARRERALAFIALYKAFGGRMPPLQAAP